MGTRFPDYFLLLLVFARFYDILSYTTKTIPNFKFQISIGDSPISACVADFTP